MDTTDTKIHIREKVDGSRTAHLEPIIEFLKARGNAPAYVDEFQYNRDGFGVYEFARPLDLDAVAQRFALPPTIKVNATELYDERNFVAIGHHLGD